MMNLSWRYPKVRVNVGIEVLTLFLYNAMSCNNESDLQAVDGTAGLLKILATTSNSILRSKVQNW